MASRVDEYLNLRRALGYRLEVQGTLLQSFARYADTSGHRGPVTIDLALAWAESSGAGPDQIAHRLSIVRQFTRHLAVVEPATEIPPPDLLPWRSHRKPPHIYSDKEYADLLRASDSLRPRGGLRPKTYVAFFSLIMATGLRCGEARHLGVRDVDLADGSLVVRNAKSGKTRLLPLHPSTSVGLARYAKLRDRYVNVSDSGYFFRTQRAPLLRKDAVQVTFTYLRRILGWTAKGRTRVPRIHDMRHTFVVRRVLAWYEEGYDIDPRMLALATYLGHVRVSHTYWYLSAVPELMAATSRRFEAFARSEGERVP